MSRKTRKDSQIGSVYFLLFLFLTLSHAAGAKVTVTVDVPSTNTPKIIEVPTLSEIEDSYNELDDAFSFSDFSSLGATEKEEFLELERRNDRLRAITNVLLRDYYQTAIESGSTFLTEEEFTTEIWPELQPTLIEHRQELENIKRPLLADYLASGKTATKFYNNSTNVQDAFATLSEWLYFVDMFPTLSDLDEAIAKIPDNASEVYADYRDDYEFSEFVEEWTINWVAAVDSDIAQAIESKPEGERLSLVSYASKRIILEEHASDITFDEPAKQDIWETIVSNFLASTPPAPLDNVF